LFKAVWAAITSWCQPSLFMDCFIAGAAGAAGVVLAVPLVVPWAGAVLVLCAMAASGIAAAPSSKTAPSVRLSLRPSNIGISYGGVIATMSGCAVAPYVAIARR
jgi:hypothetical protein